MRRFCCRCAACKSQKRIGAPMSGSFYYSTNHPAYMQALLFFRLPSQQFQHHGNGTIGCGGHRQQPIQHPSGKKIGAKKHKRSRQQKPNRTDLLYPLFHPSVLFCGTRADRYVSAAPGARGMASTISGQKCSLQPSSAAASVREGSSC